MHVVIAYRVGCHILWAVAHLHAGKQVIGRYIRNLRSLFGLNIVVCKATASYYYPITSAESRVSAAQCADGIGR